MRFLYRSTTVCLFVFTNLLLVSCQSVVPTPLPTAITSTIFPSPTPIFINATALPEIDLNAVLNEVEGQVQAKQPVQSDFATAQNGTVIQKEGQVRTLGDGYARLDLSTGTLIRMAPLSYFTLVDNQPGDEGLRTRIKLDFGQLWIILTSGAVEIETPAGQAAVRGSYMMVEIDPDTQEAFISCLEGNCDLKNPAGIVSLISGQRAKLEFPEANGEFRLPEIGQMSERDFAEWLLFSPEAQDIFPFLEEKGLLPWGNWEEYTPPDDGVWPNLDELFPNDDGFLDGDRLLPDGDGTLPNLPDLPGLPDGDGGWLR